MSNVEKYFPLADGIAPCEFPANLSAHDFGVHIKLKMICAEMKRAHDGVLCWCPILPVNLLHPSLAKFAGREFMAYEIAASA